MFKGAVLIACQPLAGKSALAAASFCAYPEEQGFLSFTGI
jgi:hypothetical protein